MKRWTVFTMLAVILGVLGTVMSFGALVYEQSIASTVSHQVVTMMNAGITVYILVVAVMVVHDWRRDRKTAVALQDFICYGAGMFLLVSSIADYSNPAMMFPRLTLGMGLMFADGWIPKLRSSLSTSAASRT